jgi:hypothetical protein
MADGDAQFQIGVVHGLADQPVYRWQDPFYQDRYDAGYVVGQLERMTRDHRLRAPEPWASFDARMKRRGLLRDS